VRPEDADEIEKRWLLQTAFITEQQGIPKALVFNWDETGFQLLNLGKYTMAKTGSTEVRLTGSGDKRQITVTTATSMDGKALPLNVIWAGKPHSTQACPKVPDIPKEWLVMQTESHWMKGPAAIKYLEQLIFPWVKKRRAELGLNPKHPALMICDTYSSHITQAFRRLCDAHNILIRYIVPGFTGALQPQDVSINKPFKEKAQEYMADYFEGLYMTWVGEGKSAIDFEIKLQKSNIGKPVMRALLAAQRWLESPEAAPMHKRAFAQFEKCYDKGFRALAKDMHREGKLFTKTGSGRGRDSESAVLAVLLAAADAESAVVPLAQVAERIEPAADEVVEEDEIEDMEEMEELNVSSKSGEESSGGEEDEEDEEEEVIVSDLREMTVRRRKGLDNTVGSLWRVAQEAEDTLKQAERKKRLKK
jgi:hypothetical protein